MIFLFILSDFILFLIPIIVLQPINNYRLIDMPMQANLDIRLFNSSL